MASLTRASLRSTTSSETVYQLVQCSLYKLDTNGTTERYLRCDNPLAACRPQYLTNLVNDMLRGWGLDTIQEGEKLQKHGVWPWSQFTIWCRSVDRAEQIVSCINETMKNAPIEGPFETYKIHSKLNAPSRGETIHWLTEAKTPTSGRLKRTFGDSGQYFVQTGCEPEKLLRGHQLFTKPSDTLAEAFAQSASVDGETKEEDVQKPEEAVGSMDEKAKQAYGAYMGVFNHKAVRMGWRILPFSRNKVRSTFEKAACLVSQLQAWNAKRFPGPSFTCTWAGGTSHDLLFDLTANDFVDAASRASVVTNLVKYTLKDGNGFLQGYTDKIIEDFIHVDNGAY
jgi:hypothetical protein